MERRSGFRGAAAQAVEAEADGGLCGWGREVSDGMYDDWDLE